MGPRPIKKYEITGSAWSSQHLELQQDGLPILYINANNKYGPWHSPYVTIQRESRNGPVIAAAKMGYPGCKRGFRIFLGNPDCTDLETWPQVRCLGAWAREYRFSVRVSRHDWGDEMWEFAWRRTRAKDLGAGGKGHRDFKLVVVGTPVVIYGDDVRCESERVEKGLLVDVDEDEDGKDEVDIVSEEKEVVEEPEHVGPNERLVAVYTHQMSMKGCKRGAHISWFEDLPGDAELWCLAAVLGLQEKITTNKQAFAIGYYGALMPLGSYF